MAVVTSNRMVSATVVLTLMIVVTGWCLAMASAVPVANVANARRLQQIPLVPLTNTQQHLQAFADHLQRILIQVKSLMEGINAQTLPQTLLSLRDPLNQALRQLQPLASTLRNQLQDQSNSGLTRKQLLQVQAAAGALNQLQAAVFGLQNVPAALTRTILILLNQGALLTVAPGGLENLQSNGQNVFGLVPDIQGSAGAQHKP